MKMGLDASGVKAGLAKAKANISNFARESMAKIGGLAKMVSVGLVAAFVSFSKKAVSLGSELSDIAESTGFATEQFQVFRGAFIRAGGSAEKMEKAIASMQKAVVQGSEGLTTYTRAFDRLGINVNELRQMRPEDQFKTIAKAIATANDQQGAFTAAQEIFGTRVAPRMMEVFRRLNEDGYEKMAEEIENTYGIMTAETQQSLDAAADAIEAFKNKITIKVGEIISGKNSNAAIKAWGTSMLIQVSHIKETMLNGIIEWGTAGPRALIAGLNTARDRLAGGEKTFNEFFGETLDFIPFEFDDSATRAILQENLDIYNAIEESSKNIAKSEREGLQYVAEKTEEQKIQEAILFSQRRGNWEAVKQGVEALNTERQIARIIKDQQVTRERAVEILNEQNEALVKQRAEALNLAEAIAAGDEQEIRAAEQRINTEARIAQLVKDAGIDKDKARQIIEQQNKQLQKQKDLHKDLLNATLTQNNRAITAAQLEIDLKERARAIADETGMAFDDAIEKARELMQMEFGPDLDMSGFVTRGERREFERQQKQIAAMNKAQEIAEQGIERHRGGGTPQAQRREGRMGTLVEGGRVINLRNASERRREMQRLEREGKQKAEAEKKAMDQAVEEAAKGDPRKFAAIVAKKAAEEAKKKEPQKPKPATTDDVVKQLITANTALDKIEKHLQC